MMPITGAHGRATLEGGIVVIRPARGLIRSVKGHRRPAREFDGPQEGRRRPTSTSEYAAGEHEYFSCGLQELTGVGRIQIGKHCHRNWEAKLQFLYYICIQLLLHSYPIVISLHCVTPALYQRFTRAQ